MVAEVVEGVLRDASAATRHAAARCAEPIVLAVFDRYPVPPALGDRRRGASCGRSLRGSLQLIGLHPPKRAMDIPEQWAQTYFDLMPIHEKLRGRDFPTTRNYLRVTLCNIHDEFVKRLDLPAVTQSFGHGKVA